MRSSSFTFKKTRKVTETFKAISLDLTHDEAITLRRALQTCLNYGILGLSTSNVAQSAIDLITKELPPTEVSF